MADIEPVLPPCSFQLCFVSELWSWHGFFTRGRAVRFSRHISLRIDWNDFLGSRNERAGFAVSSDAYQRHSATETKHGFWLVRYRIRNCLVSRKRSDGPAIRQFDPSLGTVFCYSSTCCYSRSFYRE